MGLTGPFKTVTVQPDTEPVTIPEPVEPEREREPVETEQEPVKTP